MLHLSLLDMQSRGQVGVWTAQYLPVVRTSLHVNWQISNW